MELQVGVKIILQNKEGKYLVVCRSAVKYPEAGRAWEIVGGRIKPGTPLFENLKREAEEETGLQIQKDVKLIAAQDILRPAKHIVRLTYTGFTDGEVKLSDEHTEYQWLTIKEILALEPLDQYFKEVLQSLM